MNSENKFSPLKNTFALFILYYILCPYFQTYVCSLTLQEFCVVDRTVHLGHFVCDGVSCCLTHGTSSHFPLYSFHVTDSIYRGADKSLARPGRKQATATEEFDFHISYL